MSASVKHSSSKSPCSFVFFTLRFVLDVWYLFLYACYSVEHCCGIVVLY